MIKKLYILSRIILFSAQGLQLRMQIFIVHPSSHPCKQPSVSAAKHDLSALFYLLGAVEQAFSAPPPEKCRTVPDTSLN